MQTFTFNGIHFNALLPDGRPYFIREVTPDDAPFLKEGFELLSPKSRFLRFLYPIKHLSDRDLNYLTQIDQQDHVAWCAELIGDDDFKGMGIGRFIRNKNKPESAEIAITVLDRYQRGGVGTHLSCVLYMVALVRRISTFKSFISPTNEGLLDKVGPIQSKKAFSDGVYTIDLPAHLNRTAPPFSLVGDAFFEQLHSVFLQTEVSTS